MQARVKNVFFAGVTLAALFGIFSAGFLLFYPQKLTQVKDALIAQAGAEYKLPPARLPAVVAGGVDTSFLKSFSKVFANLAKDARPALLMILSEKKVVAPQSPFPDDFFFPFAPPPQFLPPNSNGGGKRRPQGLEIDAGSGFIVDLRNGYAVTNNHVVEGAEKITITTFDNQKYKGKLVGMEKSLDIAVLKIEGWHPSGQLKQLSLADSDSVEVGDWVIALGAPFELPQTLTMGVVSALKRSGDVLGLHGPNSFIQTDAPINPGNSGGPLVSTDGQAIGMSTAIYSKNGTSVGIGFAIPSNTIRLVADSIINNGKLTQSYLGIELYDVSKFTAEALKEMKIKENTEGGLVMRVVPGSPAAKAGLLPYDIIQTINGNAVHSPSDIQSQIMFLKPGTAVKVGILRKDKRQVLTAIVTDVPTNFAEKSDKSPTPEVSQTDVLVSKYGIGVLNNKGPSGKGVKIERITPYSVASNAGLQPGDVILKVNDDEVSSKADIERVLKKTKNQNFLYLLVEKDGIEAAIILQVQ